MNAADKPVFVWLEVRGFRSFGTEARRMDLSSPLVVIHAGNSQGKTNLAEAIEFLLTGRSSRRDLFGGARAEYNSSLRNAYLPEGAEVWVAAGIRDAEGITHELRRDLVTDFVGAADCDSRLTVDGIERQDCTDFGLHLGDGVMGAPVLLQHTLRYVLSTEPKQRAAFFKALLTLTDLDLLRQRVAVQRVDIESCTESATMATVRALGATPMAPQMAVILAVDPSSLTAQQEIDGAILAAGATLTPDAESVVALRLAVEQLHVDRADRLFPLTAFVATARLSKTPPTLDIGPYTMALAKVDQAVATLLPAISALLSAPDYEHLVHPVDCPICATASALTPARIEVLRDQLRAGTDLDDVTSDTVRFVRRSRDAWTAWAGAVKSSIPVAGSWNDASVEAARMSFVGLCGDEASVFDAAVAHASALHLAAAVLVQRVKALDDLLAHLARAVERRVEPDVDLGDVLMQVKQDVADLEQLLSRNEAFTNLRAVVGPKLSQQTSRDGINELLALISHSADVHEELRARAARASAVKRLSAVDRVLRQASSAVLDSRFTEMSSAIEHWWLTIRPDELVSFAGVKRRAAGAVFVNLVASLQPQASAEAVERDALGVYSDSQLNALGLSTFLARAQLTDARAVILDDPIPGSDGDHRLTFVQNTLAGLLALGRQVILTTYDPKLAEWASASHSARDPLTFDLNLLDAVLGTEPTQTSDAYSRFMLQAEDNLNAPTAGGRRAACNAYRSAAERIAKQIIATNRSATGAACSVDDVDHEASQLGDLVQLVRGFAFSNEEAGKWSLMPKVLNPGSHDDDVPSTIELKQIRGNLRAIAKMHRNKWPDGLIG